jgi:hypothetical protein
MEAAVDDLREAVAGGSMVVLTAEGHGLVTRMFELLTEQGIGATKIEDLDWSPRRSPGS